MYSIRAFSVMALLLLGGIVSAQERFTGYFEPDISLNYDVTNTYSHNFKVAQRSYIYDEDTTFRGRQLDISHFSELQVNFNQSIALGIQYRFRKVFENDEENELRFTQQYNLLHPGGSLRLASRLRTEQRISPSLTTYRFRYRFSLDTPLNGEKLDIGESYVVLSTESLLSAAKGNKPEFDQRVTLQLGWLLNQETKLQIGTEYRAENYAQKVDHVIFVLSSLVFSL